MVDPQLIQLALTHPSAVDGEARTELSNQRLEFLGDAVLGAVVARSLYCNFPGSPEGVLTQRKAGLVQRTTLAAAARKLNLGSQLRLGRAEIAAGCRDRDSVLADALEALIGAVFLSLQWEAAQAFVTMVLESVGSPADPESGSTKNQLQELTQGSNSGQPSYATAIETGPAHCRTFVSRVSVSGAVVGTGKGHSKKIAESNAAAEALIALRAKTEGEG